MNRFRLPNLWFRRLAIGWFFLGWTGLAHSHEVNFSSADIATIRSIADEQLRMQLREMFGNYDDRLADLTEAVNEVDRLVRSRLTRERGNSEAPARPTRHKYGCS